MNLSSKTIAAVKNAALRTFDRTGRFAILRPTDADTPYGSRSAPVTILTQLAGRIGTLSDEEVDEGLRQESRRLYRVTLPAGTDVRHRDLVQFDSGLYEVLGVNDPSTGIECGLVLVCARQEG